MDPELKKLLDAMKAYSDKNKLFVAIKDEPEYVDVKNAVYQVAFNDGHAAATEAHKGAKTRLEAAVTAAQQERDELKGQLDTLKKNNPDSAALHADYGNKIAAKDKEIENLKSQHLQEKKSDTLKAIEREVEAELIAMRVDPSRAKADAISNRDQYNVHDDLSVHIIQPGQSTAFAGDRKAQVKALAAEIFKTVPKNLLVSKVPGGGSAKEGESAGDDGGEGGDKRSVFEKHKQEVQKKYGPQKGGGGGGGNGTPAADSVGMEAQRRLGQRTRA